MGQTEAFVAELPRFLGCEEESHDPVWRTDRWVAERSANRDPDSRNTKAVGLEETQCLLQSLNFHSSMSAPKSG
ncbi:unannotated protein [freshwater metagenome]|uniref:Unannotated protein n=1 Tax=freshwater metagenome TaxID=449393 RepID=A0A6J7KEM6_9ZZZZ